MLEKPPKTKRFCCSCDEVLYFEYNHHRGHSECPQCGGSVSIRLDTEDKQRMVNELLGRIKQMKINYEKKIEGSPSSLRTKINKMLDVRINELENVKEKEAVEKRIRELHIIRTKINEL